jgi:hypothetical protein
MSSDNYEWCYHCNQHELSEARCPEALRRQHFLEKPCQGPCDVCDEEDTGAKTLAQTIDEYCKRKVGDPPPSNGIKHDAGKPPMDLLEWGALEEAAHCMGFGAYKYGADQYKQGMSVDKVLAAALRHISSDLRGEHRDPESGRMHLAHALCCCMMALYLRMTPHKIKRDDRWDK